MAFDYTTKMLALKCPATSGKPNTHDVRLVNLALVSEVQIIQEATDPPPPLTNLHIAKIAARARANSEEKLRQVNYIGVGVPMIAQNLVAAITKTINEVRWDKENIIVMDQVTIVPPYGIENCRGKEGSSKALQHVKKIVDKYHRDIEREKERERGSQSPATPSS